MRFILASLGDGNEPKDKGKCNHVNFLTLYIDCLASHCVGVASLRIYIYIVLYRIVLHCMALYCI